MEWIKEIKVLELRLKELNIIKEKEITYLQESIANYNWKDIIDDMGGSVESAIKSWDLEEFLSDSEDEGFSYQMDSFIGKLKENPEKYQALYEM